MNARTAIPRNPSQSSGAIAVVRTIVFSFLCAMLARTWADPDLWGHVRFGGDTLAHGLLRADPYSYTSDIAWINHEWLAEIVMYLAWAAGGNGGLIVLKLGLTVAALLIVATTIRRENMPPVLRDLLVFVALVGVWSRVFVIRPQAFSILLFAAVLWILRSAERGRHRLLWTLPVVFGLWVNLHGGWIVGFGVIGLWAVLECSPLRRCTIPVTVLLTVVAGSALATLVNPYGVGLWAFLWRTVGLQRPNINDWRPLLGSGATVIVPWAIAAAVAVAGLWHGRSRIPASHAAIVVALGLGSVRVNRLDVFFTLSVVALAGEFLQQAPALVSPAPPRRPWSRTMAFAGFATLTAAILLLWPLRSAPICLRLDGPWMPERASGAFIAGNNFAGRFLTWFDWGQYAIWHFAPRLRVSLDGRRETVYSEAFVAEHLRLYFEPDAATDVLDRLAPDYAWLPRDIPLVAFLERRGWSRAFSGPVSVVLARRPVAVQTVAEPIGASCFPGP